MGVQIGSSSLFFGASGDTSYAEIVTGRAYLGATQIEKVEIYINGAFDDNDVIDLSSSNLYLLMNATVTMVDAALNNVGFSAASETSLTLKTGAGTTKAYSIVATGVRLVS